jgi:CRISPR-associated endonuclease/helicase Cas3
MYGLIDQVLKGQHQAFSSVILLSATLSNTLKSKLLHPYGGKVESVSYPLISHTNMENKTTEYDLNIVTVPKHVSNDIWRSESLLPDNSQQQQLIQWAEEGAMIGIICNTVNDAQQLFSLLQSKAGTIPIDLFHARFTFSDRDKIERQVLNTYGKNAKRQGRILVATQVVEQSLDLDFDVMVSQIAPIEFLMQRMGRLWRHHRINSELSPRSEAIKEPTFITLLPAQKATDWKTHYQGSGFVYRNTRVLYRTEQYLQQHAVLSFPNCYREAIEYVHQENEYSDEPVEFLKLYQDYSNEQSGALYTAKMNSNLDSKPLNDVDPRCALLTRDGEMSGSVVLMKSQGELWHGGDYNEQQDREKSTVSLAKKHVKGSLDETFYCTKGIVGKDINYTKLGVVV